MNGLFNFSIELLTFQFMNLPETLIRLNQYETKERINIIYNNIAYPITKSFAAAISPHFFRSIKANPMLKEIKLPKDLDIFNMNEFFTGKSIDRQLFLVMSIILDNKELMKRWKKENVIKKENAIDHLMIFIKYKGKMENMAEEIEFIGKHFEELENKINIDTIPSEYLCEIFKKVKGIKSEEKIKQYILKRLKEEKNENKRKKLVKSIEIEGLKNEDIQELIETVKYEDLSEQLFSTIKEKILSIIKDKNVNQKEIPNKKKLNEFQFQIEYKQNSYYKKDPNGFSPLHFAALKNYMEIGEILITKGADVNAKDIIVRNMIILF